MIQTFSTVRGDSISYRSFRTLSVFFLALAAGGAAVGMVAGAAGHLLFRTPTSGLLFLLVVVALAAGGQSGWLRLPGFRRSVQVPSSWRARFPPTVLAVLYGLPLGAGIFTSTQMTLYPVLALAMVEGLPLGALIMMAYGATRAVALILVIVWAKQKATEWTLRLMPKTMVVHHLNAWYLAAIMVALILVNAAPLWRQ